MNLFDHIAYATVDTDESLKILSILGFKNLLYYKQKLEKFDSFITKVQSKNGQIVELVEPCSTHSVVQNLLRGRQATIYHSAFLTQNLIDTLALLKEAETVIVTEPMSIPYPSSEIHKEYKTCHAFHPYIGLFEVTGNYTHLK